MSRDSAAASPPSEGPSPDLSSDMDTNALLRRLLATVQTERDWVR